MLLVRLLGGFCLDCGEALDPRTQVVGEDQGAATALHGAQFADLIAS